MLVRLEVRSEDRLELPEDFDNYFHQKFESLQYNAASRKKNKLIDVKV